MPSIIFASLPTSSESLVRSSFGPVFTIPVMITGSPEGAFTGGAPFGPASPMIFRTSRAIAVASMRR